MTESNHLPITENSPSDADFQRKFWSVISISIMALLAYMYLFSNLFSLEPTTATYIKMFVNGTAIVLSITNIILALRRRVDTALTILFYYLLLVLMTGPATTQGRTLYSTTTMLVVGILMIGWLLPKEKSRRNAFLLAGAYALAWVFEWINPPWRVTTGAAIIGPIVAVLFTLTLIFLLVRQAWKGNSLQNKLLIILGSIIVALVGIISTTNIINAQQKAREDEQRALSQLYVDYNDDVHLQENGAAMISISLAEREEIKSLYLADDREGLLTLLTPMFETLKNEHDIRHLYVENPDGTVYVRVHNPSKFGDDVTYRRTAAASLTSQETVAGVEIGPGRLGIRSVSPLYDAGAFIGMVEVGIDYDQTFIDDFKAHTGAEYTMWITNEAAACQLQLERDMASIRNAHG